MPSVSRPSSHSVTLDTRTLSVSIERDPRTVYEFASDPSNLPQWASGLAQSLKKVGEGWIAETPQGSMKLRFAERNTFGVLDHYVVPESGAELYIPMRVISNGAGSELIFTLFRSPGTTHEQLEADAKWVLRDLGALKRILEA